MIRVYFVFKDPLDEAEVNLSFVDVPTRDPHTAFERVENSAKSGELWRNLYPDDQDHPYVLIKTKMMCLDVSTIPEGRSVDTVLTL